MDLFLNFKDKSLSSKYLGNLDFYTSRLLYIQAILAILIGSFIPYYQYRRYNKEGASSVAWRTTTILLFYFGFLAIAIAVRKFRYKLVKIKYCLVLFLDILYLCGSAYLSYIIWENNKKEANPAVRFLNGWLGCLILIFFFANVTRWYLKVIAYLVIVLRVGVGTYETTYSDISACLTVQLALMLCLMAYWTEKANRKEFIEKQSLFDESQSFKEILKQTTDGIVIIGIEGGFLFQNWVSEKHKWWNVNRSFDENTKRIRITKKMGFFRQNDTTLNTETEITSESNISLPMLIESLKEECNIKYKRFLELNQKTGIEEFKVENLAILTGRIEESGVIICQVEIKIMSLAFKSQPALALMISDITERNLVVTLQDNNNYKNRLLASVSHELRTPLNASINFTQMALEDPKMPHEIRDGYLVPALRSNQLLLHIINDILDFSQMTTNKLQLVLENCDIKTTVDQCLELIQIQASRKGLTLSVEYENETSSFLVRTDHNRLKQVILNLLSNAIKFTLNGGIVLKIRIITSIIYGRKINIDVIDTGIGISMHDKKLLHKTLEKSSLGDRLSLNLAGTGLGLVISNNLVLMLGPPEQNNYIQVESRLNYGSTFSFWIIDKKEDRYLEIDLESPSENHNILMNEAIETEMDNDGCTDTLTNLAIKRNDTRFDVSSTASLNLNRSPFDIKSCRCPSILVVDDDIFNIDAIKLVLKKLGYTCDQAYNGKQAIEFVLQRKDGLCNFRCTQYKLIIMDCSMPIMDGFDATKKLRDLMRDEVITYIPIVACTAFVQEKEKQKALQAGMDGHCTKPITVEKMKSVLQKFISKSAPPRRLDSI